MADSVHIPVRGRRQGGRRAKAASVRGRRLGLSADSTMGMVQQVNKGFPYAALVRFHKESGLSMGCIAQSVQLPPRTLVRRKASGRLHPDESERLLRLARIFDMAVELFEGDVDAARRWLTAPSRELDDQTPLDFAHSELGAREVEDLMGRLEHGVFT